MRRSKDRYFSRRAVEPTAADTDMDTISSRKPVTPTKATRALDGMTMDAMEDDEQTNAKLHPIFRFKSKPSTAMDTYPSLNTLGSPVTTRRPSTGRKLPMHEKSSVSLHKSVGPENIITKRPDPFKFTSSSTTSAPPMCKLEGCSKPAYVEGTRVHDYCGRTHYLLGTGQSDGGDFPVELRCNTPGCKRQKYKSNGGYFDYCSKSCRDRGSLSQLSLPGAPVIKDICRIARANRDEYQKLSRQFVYDWVKGNPPPLFFISVYMITNTALEREWLAYKDQLSDTTIERHYHGTKLCCDISSLQLCSNKSCGICGITRNSFDRSFVGTNISRFKRFGNAFYLAPHSSKCHDYTVGYGQHRAMLYFQTLPGRKFTLEKTDEKFVLPPGYDSAYGIPGQSLNYPELMLYKSETALPLCIFTYMKDGIEQIAK